MGVDCTTIGVSLDVDLFRPRPRRRVMWPDAPLRIAAMVRPHSPYREPGLTMALLQQASKRYGRGKIEVTVFGTAPKDPLLTELSAGSFPWQLAGVLYPRQTARLLNEVDVFVDFSAHQAMGLTALEAMACGAAVIVPQKGGAVSFARDCENSLVVDTSSAEACWGGLQRLIEDHELRARLQQQALRDVCQYYPERAAYAILATLLGREGRGGS